MSNQTHLCACSILVMMMMATSSIPITTAFANIAKPRTKSWNLVLTNAYVPTAMDQTADQLLVPSEQNSLLLSLVTKDVRPVIQQETESDNESIIRIQQDHSSPETSLPLLNTEVPSYRTLGAFLSTTILMFLAEPLLSLVDTTVVSLTQGDHAVTQLAALGPATTLMDSCLWCCLFLASTTTNLISEARAKHNLQQLQTHTSHMLGVAAAMGGAVSILVWGCGHFLLNQMAGASASPQLVQLATRYCAIRALVAPLAVMGMVAQSHSMAHFDTTRPALAVAAASVVNIVGDLLLAPWGVVGAAIATAVSTTVASLILLQGVFCRMREWRTLQSSQINDHTRPIPFMSLPSSKEFVQLIAVSGPLCFNMWAKILCYSALNIRATSFGVVSLAAHNIMMRVFFFFGCFADSIGQAAQTFIPPAVYPQKDPVALKLIVRRLLVLASVFAVVNSQLAAWLLVNMGGYLAKDAGIVSTIQGNTLFLSLSLLLHPLIVLVEGGVIATRQFPALIMTYMCTAGIHAALLAGTCSSFGHVWRALFGFQVARLFNYSIWGRTRRQNEAVTTLIT